MESFWKNGLTGCINFEILGLMLIPVSRRYIIQGWIFVWNIKTWIGETTSSVLVFDSITRPEELTFQCFKNASEIYQ